MVVHIHGLDGNFYRSNLVWELADFYVRNGYDFLAINTRGSLMDERRVEAQLFDYAKGEFKLFRRIKTPMLAVFGNKEEYKMMAVSKYLDMLRKASTSRCFGALEIRGADHGFSGKEKELAQAVVSWLDNLRYPICSFL